jgi:hypothetical protein
MGQGKITCVRKAHGNVGNKEKRGLKGKIAFPEQRIDEECREME